MNIGKSSIMVLAACLPLFVTACWSTPGADRKARVGYQAAAPIIAALGKFHNDRGHYPTNLCELVPAYLPDTNSLFSKREMRPSSSPRSETSAPQTLNVESRPFWYAVEGDEFNLSFGYFGPGANTCSYSSRTGKWSASGYY